MTLRIGGELELAAELLGAPERGDLPALPKPHVARLDTGRSALYAALCEIVRRGGKRRAWLPAYLCASVLAPFRQLDFEVSYYRAGRDLVQPEFPAQIGSGEVFLFAHYFGKQNKAAAEWLGQLPRRRELFVIEDGVQASLNASVGSHGDSVITSYRKFLPQPDGALLGADHALHAELAEPDEQFVSAKALGKLLRQYTGNQELYLSLFAQSEQRLERPIVPRRMSWLSRHLMQRTDIAAVAEARRANWAALARLLAGGAAAVVPLYHGLEPGEVPLGFPVRVGDGQRDALRRHLAERQVYCPVHWDLPHLPEGDAWQDERALSAAVLTLPIDQRMGNEHLQFMVRAIESFEGNRK